MRVSTMSGILARSTSVARWLSVSIKVTLCFLEDLTVMGPCKVLMFCPV